MPCQGAQYCIQGCFQHSGTPGLLRYIDSLTILSSRARAARLSNTRISALSKLLFQVGAFPNSMGLKAQSFRAGVRGWRFLSFKGCTRGFGSVAPGFQKSKPNSPFWSLLLGTNNIESKQWQNRAFKTWDRWQKGCSCETTSPCDSLTFPQVCSAVQFGVLQEGVDLRQGRLQTTLVRQLALRLCWGV